MPLSLRLKLLRVPGLRDCHVIGGYVVALHVCEHVHITHHGEWCSVDEEQPAYQSDGISIEGVVGVDLTVCV